MKTVCLKVTVNLQYGKSLAMVSLSLVLKSSENLPKYDKTKVNSLLRTMKLWSFLIQNLFKNILIHRFT